MQKIDLFFLFHFQKFSDWTQEWFGLNNFFWARVSLLMFSISAFGVTIIDAGLNGFRITAIFLFIVVGGATRFILWKLQSMETQYLKQDENTATPSDGLVSRREDYLVFFPLSLIFALFAYGHLTNPGSPEDYVEGISCTFWSIGCMSFFKLYYFAACKPRRLKKIKVKEILEKLKKKIAAAPQLAS